MQFNLVHISAGDLLRAEVASGSENGKKAESFMSQGFLVPNELVSCPYGHSNAYLRALPHKSQAAALVYADLWRSEHSTQYSDKTTGKRMKCICVM